MTDAKTTDADAQSNRDRAEEAGESETATASSTDPEGSAEKEIGGPPGPEPTRYGDWEKKGRCIDF